MADEDGGVLHWQRAGGRGRSVELYGLSSPAASLGSDTGQVPGAGDAGPQEPEITLVIPDGDALDGDRRQGKESLAAASC